MVITPRMASEELARRAISNRVRSSLTFREFVTRVNPKYKWYRHCIALADILQKVADGEIKRLMVYMPPRHGKSELVSRLFSAYFLYRYPERWVGINSYASELSFTLSRAARQNFVKIGGKLSPESSAVAHWETTSGGGMWSAGVGGPITGKGFHLGIIDDPVKNAEDAESETLPAKQQDWYGSTFYTREEPNADGEPDGAIIHIQTRWAENDLGGYLLEQETADEEGLAEHWHIVCYEAIKEEKPQKFPATCTVEPDWRKPGEALCPERRPIEKLLKIASRIGKYFFAALFQQNPFNRGSGIFDRDAFNVITWDELQERDEGVVVTGLGVDLAVTQSTSADYTVALPGCLTKLNNVFIFRPFRDKVEWAGKASDKGKGGRAWIYKTAQSFRARLIGVDATGPQKGLAQELAESAIGCTVIPITAVRDKQARAREWSPIVEQGRVYLVEDGSGWTEVFLAEIERFPKGKNDDQVDACTNLMEVLSVRVDPREMTQQSRFGGGPAKSGVFARTKHY